MTTLIVSVSGPATASLPNCAEFATELDSRRVPASWLLPPRPRDGRHHRDAPLIRWLRGRVGIGDAMVLHGFDHAVDPIGGWRSTSLARIGRKAEFAALPSHEAALRLIAATRVMDDLGLGSDAFTPPRWLASAGTLVALRRRGFRVCADGAGVRLLDSGRLLRGRALTVGPADGAEAWRCRALVVAAARASRRGGLVRVAAAASDLRRSGPRRAILDAVDAALAAGAMPATYRAPVPAGGAAALSA